MSAWTRWRARARNVLTRHALDRDLDRELDAWVDELTARYQTKGLSAEHARRRALAETGSVEHVKASVRDRLDPTLPIYDVRPLSAYVSMRGPIGALR